MKSRPTPHPDAFDAALRARHAEAIACLSPQVRAQLTQRRNAALRGECARRRSHGVRYAVAGFATLGALAIGLSRLLPSPPTATPVAPAPAWVTQTAPLASSGSLALDEDPDFYAWLGSADARRLAME